LNFAINPKPSRKHLARLRRHLFTISPCHPPRVNPASSSRRTDLAVAITIFLAVVLTRCPTFLRSVLDWDESLYLLIAAQWRAGQLPYTTIWDNKPVGIYAIFAVFQAAFGAQIAAMRIATICFVSLAAYAAYRIAFTLCRQRRAGVLAAAAFVIASLSNDGLAANTEIFMAAFTSLAVCFALSPGRPVATGLLVGLMMGCAFMIKYVAIFEDPAILLLLLSRHARRDAPAAVLAMLAGAAIPLTAVIAIYAQAGDLPLWWACSVASNFRRVATQVQSGALIYAIQTQLWRWGPLYLLAGITLANALWRRNRAGWPNHLFLVLWFLGGCLGVAAAKSFYDHYFLQLLPVLCIIFGCSAAVAPPWSKSLFVIAVLALPGWAAVAALGDAARPVIAWRGGIVLLADGQKTIASDLAAPLAAAPDARIYVFDSQPILYSLVNRPPPTRFAFPSVLTTIFLANVADVDAVAEETRILAAEPLFIIRRPSPPRGANALNPPVYALLSQTLATHYRLWRRYPNALVYENTAVK
jgi:4-amino-4-deoxy-L-arabinose transferase-like glycosyltransferase